MSWIDDIRTDVADAIEAIPEFSTETVVRSWVPDIDRDKLAQREIHISPEGRATTIIGRNCRKHVITVWVAIIDPFVKIGTEDAQAIQGHDLADVVVGLLGTRLGGISNAMCTAIEQPVTTSPSHWNELRSFATFLKLTLET